MNRPEFFWLSLLEEMQNASVLNCDSTAMAWVNPVLGTASQHSDWRRSLPGLLGELETKTLEHRELILGRKQFWI